MTLRKWGRLLLIWGLAGIVLSAAPALLLSLAGTDGGFFGLVAVMMALSVTPLSAVVASAGAILLLVAALRRDPY